MIIRLVVVVFVTVVMVDQALIVVSVVSISHLVVRSDVVC